MKKEKGGWIRVVEAFVAILLITGVLLVVIDRGYLRKDISREIINKQMDVLREIQINDSMRESIIKIEDVYLDTGIFIDNTHFPESVSGRIQDLAKEIDLNCTAKICKLELVCALDHYPDKDVYSRSITIATTLETYNPRQLRIFCWRY